MEIPVLEEQQGKCLRLNFLITFKKQTSEKLSGEFNINNLAKARFKLVNDWTCEMFFIYLSLKKHVLAKDAVVKLNVNTVNNGTWAMTNYSEQWMCTEHWTDWQKIVAIDIERITSNSSIAISFYLAVIKGKSSISEHIYADENWTDFILRATDGSVSVHKACLAAHSDVFNTMLSQEWKETTEGYLKIDGITLQTLQHLKQYMYLGTLPDDGLRPLLLIAMCYLMDELKSECISKLACTVTSEDLDDLLDFARENKVPELVFAILEVTPRQVVHGAYQLRETKAVPEKDAESAEV